MEQTLNPNIAHENYNRIVLLRTKIKDNLYLLVKCLKQARESKEWEILGYESWASFLAQPEIDLSVHTVDNYITTLNRLEEHQLPPDGVDVSKLSIIAPHLTPENKEELILKAKTLSRSDLRLEVGLTNSNKVNLMECPNCHTEFEI